MWKQILVPLDGSQCAWDAFDLVMDFASRGTELLVCAVADPHQIAGKYPQAGSALGSWIAQVREDAREIVADAARRARERGIPCETSVLFEGPPADAIVAFAQERHADAIVMGTHGRSGFAHALMGSVAENVLRRAHCAVVTLRPARPAGESSRPLEMRSLSS